MSAEHGSVARVVMDPSSLLSASTLASLSSSWLMEASVGGLSSSLVSNASVCGALLSLPVSAQEMIQVPMPMTSYGACELLLAPRESSLGSTVRLSVVYSFRSKVDRMVQEQVVVSAVVAWSSDARVVLSGPVEMRLAAFANESLEVSTVDVVEVARRSAVATLSSLSSGVVAADLFVRSVTASVPVSSSSRLSLVSPDRIRHVSGGREAWVLESSVRLSGSDLESDSTQLLLVSRGVVSEQVPLWMNVSFVDRVSQREVLVGVAMGVVVAPRPSSLLNAWSKEAQYVSAEHGSVARVVMDPSSLLSASTLASLSSSWLMEASVGGLSSSLVSNASVCGALLSLPVSAQEMIQVPMPMTSYGACELLLAPRESSLGSTVRLSVVYSFRSKVDRMVQEQVVVSAVVAWSSDARVVLSGPVEMRLAAFANESLEVSTVDVVEVARRSAVATLSSLSSGVVAADLFVRSVTASVPVSSSSRLSLVSPDRIRHVSGGRETWVLESSVRLSGSDLESDSTQLLLVSRGVVSEQVPLWMNVSFVDRVSQREVLVGVAMGVVVAPRPSSLLNAWSKEAQYVSAEHGSVARVVMDPSSLLSASTLASLSSSWLMEASVGGLSSSLVSNASVCGALLSLPVSAQEMIQVPMPMTSYGACELLLAPRESSLGSTVRLSVVYSFRSKVDRMVQEQVVVSAVVAWSSDARVVLSGPVEMRLAAFANESLEVSTVDVVEVARRSAVATLSSLSSGVVAADLFVRSVTASVPVSSSSRLSLVSPDRIRHVSGGREAWVLESSVRLSGSDLESDSTQLLLVSRGVVSEQVPLWMNVSFVDRVSQREVLVGVAMGVVVAPRPSSLLNAWSKEAQYVSAEHGSVARVVMDPSSLLSASTLASLSSSWLMEASVGGLSSSLVSNASVCGALLSLPVSAQEMIQVLMPMTSYGACELLLAPRESSLGSTVRLSVVYSFRSKVDRMVQEQVVVSAVVTWSSDARVVLSGPVEMRLAAFANESLVVSTVDVVEVARRSAVATLSSLSSGVVAADLFVRSVSAAVPVSSSSRLSLVSPDRMSGTRAVGAKTWLLASSVRLSVWQRFGERFDAAVAGVSRRRVGAGSVVDERELCGPCVPARSVGGRCDGCGGGTSSIEPAERVVEGGAVRVG